VWILNGSKIWSSGASVSDYAMCLARTNWDVPKHRGLTMFLLKIHQPGIRVDRIKQADGSMEFCQEFFDDVVIPATDVIGEVDDGWTVASRLLLHERSAVGGGSPYTSGRSVGQEAAGVDRSLAGLAEATGRSGDPLVRQLVAEAHVLQLVSGHLISRVTKGITTGAMPPPAGALLKLFSATLTNRRAEIGIEVAGNDGVAWPAGTPGGSRVGEVFVARQQWSMGGGTNEIQRNVISERVLGMPREWSADKDVPYRDVRKNAVPSRPQ
jgi:alkylation response protein AidB-like acyl-CoA dehydrogenase